MTNSVRNIILWVGCLSLVVLMIAGFFYLKHRQVKLISPIFGIPKNRFADNIWFPKEASDESEPAMFYKISARSAFFVETRTGQVLFEKNAHQKLPVASLVKIMTVIIALENRSFDEILKVSAKAANMEPDRMILIEGEKLRLEELLDGIFLVSANDAAEVLAERATGRREDLPALTAVRQAGRQEFINLMNSKALQLGMGDSQFINPTGLEEDGRSQYSSAYDVALMVRYAIYKWPHLVEISSKQHIFIPETDTHQDYDLYSGINLLTTYPGVLGFKTGYTPEAGLTLATLARREGKEVLGVILGSEDRRDDAKELLDYSFKKLGVKNETASD